MGAGAFGDTLDGYRLEETRLDVQKLLCCVQCRSSDVKRRHCIMNWKPRIEVNPNVLSGRPVIRGTRISVELLLDRLAEGWSMDDVLASYPHLTREDVLTAIAFAAELFKEETFVAVSKVTSCQSDHQ